MAESSDAEISERSVDENSIFDSILKYHAALEYERVESIRVHGAQKVTQKMPEALKKELPKSDWRLLRYINNRQIGGCNTHCVHSSMYAVQRLDLLHKLKGEMNPITSLNFNHKGNLLVSGSNDDGTITIWDWERGVKLKTLENVYPQEHEIMIYHLKWLPLDVECFLISSDSNGEVCMINVHTGHMQTLLNEPANRHAFTTVKDFPWIVLSADDDSNIYSIDVRENRVTKLLSAQDVDGYHIQLVSIDSHPSNGYEFCVAGNMSCVNVYDRRNPANFLYQIYPEHMGLNAFIFVDRALYNHDGSEILAAYGDEAVYLFDITSSNRRKNYVHKYEEFLNSANTLKDVNFVGPKSEFVVTSLDDGQIFIWDKKTEAIVHLIQGDENFGSIEPHPHFPILATSGNDICIWTPSSEE